MLLLRCIFLGGVVPPLSKGWAHWKLTRLFPGYFVCLLRESEKNCQAWIFGPELRDWGPPSSIKPLGQTAFQLFETVFNYLTIWTVFQTQLTFGVWAHCSPPGASPGVLQVSLPFVSFQLQMVVGSCIHPAPQLPVHGWVPPYCPFLRVVTWSWVQSFCHSKGMVNCAHIPVLFSVPR